MENPQDSMPAPEQPEQKDIDQVKLDLFMQQIRDNQNLSAALFGGFVAALVGSIVWGAVTYFTEWQIGFMAVGVGFLVGYAVRTLGNGLDMSFGVVGAVMSLLGCVLGNYLAVSVWIAQAQSIPILDQIFGVDLDFAMQVMIESFHPMDVLFYAIAIYYGYKSSFRTITDEEMSKLVRS